MLVSYMPLALQSGASDKRRRFGTIPSHGRPARRRRSLNTTIRLCGMHRSRSPSRSDQARRIDTRRPVEPDGDSRLRPHLDGRQKRIGTSSRRRRLVGTVPRRRAPIVCPLLSDRTELEHAPGRENTVDGRVVPMSSSELSDSVLQTKPSFHEDEVEVPLYDVSKPHKTLGCWVSPTMSQAKQKKVLIEMCRKWSQRMTTSYLTAYEIRRAYESVLLKQIDYRLVTACFTYDDCKDIMKHYIPKLCHSFHIHRHMDRNLVFGAKKYGGLGIKHLYDVK